MSEVPDATGGSRRLLTAATATLATVLLSNVALAEQKQTCVVITEHDKSADDRSTIDAIMAGLGGASSVAVLIVGGRLNWLIKTAAVAEIASTVWNVAKAYAGSGGEKDTRVCVTENSPGQTLPAVSIGPSNDTTKYAVEGFRDYLNSQAGKSQLRQLTPGTEIDVSKTDWAAIGMGRVSGWGSTPPRLPSEIAAARQRAQEADQRARDKFPLPGSFSLEPVQNGYSIQYLGNGDYYSGEFRDYKPAGYGIYTFASGFRYEGQLQKGALNGWGYEETPLIPGFVLMGYFENGLLVRPMTAR